MPTLATLESTAFLALGFGAGNGQDFRTRRDPLGRFTLFLISQLVSGSRVRIEFIYRIKQVCRTTMPSPVRPACGGSEGPWAIFLGKCHKEVDNHRLES